MIKWVILFIGFIFAIIYTIYRMSLFIDIKKLQDKKEKNQRGVNYEYDTKWVK